VANHDDSPLERPVQLDLLCGGRVQQQVFSSETGSFSFIVESRKAQEWMDASAGRDGGLDRNSHWNSSIDKEGVFAASRFKTFNLSGCRIQLSGNQGLFANAINLSNRSVFDNPNVGTIVLFRDGSGQSPTVETAEFLVPPSARMAFAKALEEISKEKPNRARALRELAKAVKDYPGYAEAWQLRGELHLEQGEREAARKSFEEALSADPGYPKPYLSIARLALFDENWEEAALMSERMLKILPNSAQGNYFNGLANFYLGREEPAERALRFLKDEGLGRRYPVALFHLGMIDARRGRIAEAAEEFASYLENMPPDEIPPGQKERLERQLAAWGREDLISDGKRQSP
jgi:tetratricopeptide (TPR) repeat protein